MIPPSYLFPVDRLRNGPSARRAPWRIMASVWPAAIAGGLAGGAVALVMGVFAA
ncbi:MAG: hypothetical protein AAF318_04520 [Pseudomonadota bacterium]